jgi:aspartate kinase
MALIVQKYGGTSVGSLERIAKVAKNVSQAKHNGNQVIVVVSAMSGETNRLLELAHNITPTPDQRALDTLAATGEQVTISLLNIALIQLGLKVKSYCGWQVPILTSNDFTQARIKHINTQKIKRDLADDNIVIVAGFQGMNEEGEITTLGRGGSDTSAVALAVAFQASECQIYTDVNGIYTADPNKVVTAQRIEIVNGTCMLEASSLGAKVLHVRSCELGYRYKTNIRVLSSFAPQDQGSLVVNQYELENYPIISLSTQEQQVLFTFKPSLNLNQVLTEIYSNSAIDMLQINQQNISFVVEESQATKLTKALTQLGITELHLTHNLAKFSLIGSGFRSNRELNQQVWHLLTGSDIFAVSHNEISISVLVHDWEAATVRTKLSKMLAY